MGASVTRYQLKSPVNSGFLPMRHIGSRGTFKCNKPLFSGGITCLKRQLKPQKLFVQFGKETLKPWLN
jgi:hypothetical protein